VLPALGLLLLMCRTQAGRTGGAMSEKPTEIASAVEQALEKARIIAAPLDDRMPTTTEAGQDLPAIQPLRAPEADVPPGLA
jgi:hypothetical protein